MTGGNQFGLKKMHIINDVLQQLSNNILAVDVNHKRLKRKNRVQTTIIIITFARAVMKVTTHKMFNLYYKTNLCIIICLVYTWYDIVAVIIYIGMYIDIYIMYKYTRRDRASLEYCSSPATNVIIITAVV